jgi:hypothetical protein
MAVPRSIPANFAATGWVIGILALVYSSVVTYDTSLVIGQLCESSGATSFPELAAEAIGRRSDGGQRGTAGHTLLNVNEVKWHVVSSRVSAPPRSIQVSTPR